jgi:hypothetical protein
MQQEINLYGSEFRPETNAFQSIFMFQAAALLIVALTCIYLFARHEVSGVDAEIELVARLESAAIERLQTVGPLITSITGEQTWAQQLDEATRMLAERQSILNLIQSTALGKTDGFSAQLRALSRQDVDGVWLTRILLSSAGQATRIEGRAFRAELIPVYVQDLTAEPSFSQLRFHRFQIDNPLNAADSALVYSMDSQVLTARNTGAGT